MKILLINKFLYPKGGDAISTLTTGRILSSYGHEVVYWGMDHPDNPCYQFSQYFVSNIDYSGSTGIRTQAKAVLNILYSFEGKKKIAALLEEFKPDMVHVNNFAHQISPSILDEIKKHYIPVVMTMHDYKMVCPTYSMLLNAKPCEKCRGGRFYHCAIHRCTKGSYFKSLINVAEMYLHHNLLHIYDHIDLYISPSKFLKDKVQEMGLKGEVVYLPNCVDVSAFEPAYEWQEQSIVYVGRLSPEKGVQTLVNAVKGLPEIQLKIIGDGPIRPELEKQIASEDIPNVFLCGYKTGKVLHDEIKKAMFLVIPSEWYENNPRTVIEAFALGKPVVGARIGGIPELVHDWETGLTYESGKAIDLRAKIDLMLSHSENIPQMGRTARAYVEKEFNSETHYERLMEIYKHAADKAAKQRIKTG